ncbi:uncharacterized protein LOC135352573 [Latimeria chalumnae]|uniref:uncharacterized protein LOC135352573 n=1 Tax=Latimeria chalumnae TaxID=7897 RepID=UPI00313AC34A
MFCLLITPLFFFPPLLPVSSLTVCMLSYIFQCFAPPPPPSKINKMAWLNFVLTTCMHPCWWASVPLDNYASDLSAEEQVVMEGFASSCYPSNKPPSPAASSLEYLSDCNSGPLLPQPCGMEESWFVTPPPCFTAECEGPVKVESSPMENLLIEHPSMSVYSSSNPGNNSTMEEITLDYWIRMNKLLEFIASKNTTIIQLDHLRATSIRSAIGKQTSVGEYDNPELFTNSSKDHVVAFPQETLGLAKKCLNGEPIERDNFLSTNFLILYFFPYFFIRTLPQIQVERRTATHPTAITSQARTLEKVSHIRHIQRAKLRVEKHWLTKSHFQRQNLARECRPRRAKHQGSFVYQPCQRQYNH